MDMSVIIPTHRRPEKAAACAQALLAQSHPAEKFEVLIGLDGPDDAARTTIERRAASPRVRVVECPRGGQASVRNRLMAMARGRLLGMLNDDMIPDRGWVAAHVAAQEEAAGHGVAVPIIVGASPWRMHQPDRLFDRLVRETSMVFFHHVMKAGGEGGSAPREPEATRADVRWRDWGFRHAWTLNLSVPRDVVMAAGGFSVFPCIYGYEDDELAFRLRGVFGSPVLYREQARAEHDHRMEPSEYLLREYRLGYAALGFARQSPACAAAMFGRDVTRVTDLMYDRASLSRESRDVSRLIDPLVALAEIPAEAVAGAHASSLMSMIYLQHLPLKRWCWRRGLVDAAEGQPMRERIDDVLSPLLTGCTALRAA